MGWSNVAPSVLEANTVIVIAGQPNTGIFLYNGTPATGNLIGSWAAAAGTDQFGNAYPQGIAEFSGGASPDIGLNLGQLLIGTAATGFPNGATISGANTPGQIRLATGNPAGTPAKVLHDLFPGASGAHTGTATTPYAAFAASGLSGSVVDLYLTGSVISGGAPGSAATWQSVSSLLGSGWANGPVSGSVQNLQFRLDVQNNLVLTGVVHSTSATPAAIMFTLPGLGGYRPAIEQRFAVAVNSGGTTSAASLRVSSNGDVQLAPNLAAANGEVYIYGTVPLGIIP